MMRNKAQVYFHKSVVRIEKTGVLVVLHFSDGTTYQADKVLTACGGFSKKEQYKWLEDVGHTIQSPVPSLFTFNMPKHPITELMGVSVGDATVKIAGSKVSAKGPLLITHWGMSGPAILKTSAIGARELAERNYEFRVLVNWLGEMQEDELRDMINELRREQGKQQVAGKCPFGLPKRLWEYLIQQCGVKDETRWGDLPAAMQNKLVEHLLRDGYDVKGKTTFKEEFVTCGGINLSEIDAHTMQSRVVPGLYFAGELLDVDGITGGYNFQHAWSSGYVAASNMVSATK
jgi:predicted Rossmann fold flavoprotein